ncbi:Mg-protoporphyrin IX methyl transferase [compost metagenome]
MTVDPFREIDAQTIRRYRERFHAFGEDHRTLGWGSREQQVYRFNQLMASTAFERRSVLDIGCGFADLLGHLTREGQQIASYTGVDINPDFVDVARAKYPEAEFITGSPRDLDPETASRDVVVMLGLLNFRQSNLSNLDYAHAMIGQAFSLCREALVVDMLSAYRTPDYPEEDFVYYYEPTEMLKLAFSLTPFVTLLHDYQPIPQQEFLIVLRKLPCA